MTWMPDDVSTCSKCSRAIILARSTSTGGTITVALRPSADGTLSVRPGVAGAIATPITARHRFGRTDLRLPHPAECQPRAPKPTEHAFEPDPDVPADPYDGRQWCHACGLAGEPGDCRHPHGALPLVVAPRPAFELAARRNGKSGGRQLADQVLGEVLRARAQRLT